MGHGALAYGTERRDQSRVISYENMRRQHFGELVGCDAVQLRHLGRLGAYE